MGQPQQQPLQQQQQQLLQPPRQLPQKQQQGGGYSVEMGDHPEYSGHQRDQRGRQRQPVGQLLFQRAEENSGRRQAEEGRSKQQRQHHRGRGHHGRQPRQRRRG